MNRYSKGLNSDVTEVGFSINNLSSDKVSVLSEIIKKDYQDYIDGKEPELTRVLIQRGNFAYQFNLDVCSTLQIDVQPRFDVDYVSMNYPFKRDIGCGTSYNLEAKYFISDNKKIKLPKQETDVTNYLQKWKEEVIKNQEDYELDEIIIRNKKDGKLYAVKGLTPINMEK